MILKNKCCSEICNNNNEIKFTRNYACYLKFVIRKTYDAYYYIWKTNYKCFNLKLAFFILITFILSIN